MYINTLSYIHNLLIRDVTANEIALNKARDELRHATTLVEGDPDNQNLQELYEEASENCKAWEELHRLSRSCLDDFESNDWR